MNHNDRNIGLLNSFLENTQGFLFNLIQDQRIIKNFNDISDVWRVINESLEKSKHYLENPHIEIMEKLESVGLTSNQLMFKLKGFDKLCGLWKLKGKQWSLEKFKTISRFILKWINNILGSMSIVIPGLEIVKEFKEHIELAIDIDDITGKFEELSEEFSFLKF